MSGIPDAALRPVQEAGEEILGTLLTAGQVPALDAHGDERALPIWFVVTDQRAWLVAGDDDHRWAVATGDPAAVRLERGWTWDQLHVGTHHPALRRGTRKAALALVARFHEAGGGGDPFPSEPPPPPPGGRAPIARGADDVPPWLAAAVPADPEERWLHATRMATRQPFAQLDGTIAHGHVWIALTDRRCALAAQGPDEEVWHDEVPVPLLRQPRPGSDCLLAGGRTLWGPPLTDRGIEIATWLSQASDPAERWARIATATLDDGHARRAVRLVAAALQAGHDRSWEVLARLLAKAGAPELAAAAAARALQVDPTLDVQERVAAWNRAADLRHLRREDVDVAYLRGLMREPVRELGVPEPPTGLPWPPRTPDAVWAAALALRERYGDATRLWEGRGIDARQLVALASLKTAEGADDAASAWDTAAEALRAAGEAEAPSALEQAIALDPTPARLWRRAAWAWDDDDFESARRYWVAAVLVDPEGTEGVPLPPDARRALARHAEAEQEWRAAATAWRQALDADPGDAEGWRRAARILDRELDAPAEAAEVLAAYVEHHGSMEPEPEPRWCIRRDLARLQLRAGDRDSAAATLRALVRGDFLHPDALDAALELGEGLPLPLPWWRHLHHLLKGAGDGGEPLVPRDALSAEQRDGLHPGGVPFLERVRQSLHGAEPPDRSQLVRGLERLGEHNHPAVWQAVVELSEALGMAPPDVFLFRGDGAWGCSAWKTDPPLILVGAEHLVDGPRQLSDTALRFLLAVELAHLACDHPVLFFDTDLVGTSRSVYSAFGKYAGTAEAVVDVVSLVPGIDQLTKLQTVLLLSRRVFATRSAIDKASDVAAPVLSRLGLVGEDGGSSVGREGLAGAALAMRVQADRIALLLIGNIDAAVDGILRSSSRSLEAAERVDAEGLAAVLASDPPPEALRISALMEFAATLGEELPASP